MTRSELNQLRDLAKSETRRPRCPSDDQIIEALALHFRVHEASVIAWLIDMDLAAASQRVYWRGK